MDPNSIVIVAGQALIFSQTEGSVKKYSYRLHNGETGEIPFSIVTYLGLSENELPAVVSSSKLLAAMDSVFVEEGEFIVAMSQKANYSTMMSMMASKATRAQLADLINKVVFKDEFQLSVNTKANTTDVQTYLDTKANSSEVYTKEQIHSVMMDFIGAACVENIANRNALERGMYPFVWVKDASADLSSSNIQSPALYCWSVDHWEYLGTVGSIGGIKDWTDDIESLNNSVDSIENRIVVLQDLINAKASCVCAAKFGDGVTNENTVTMQFNAVRDRLDTNETSITNLQNKDTELDGKITELQTTVSGLNSCKCSEKFGDGVTKDNTVTQQFTAINSRVDAQSDRLDTLESTVDNLETCKCSEILGSGFSKENTVTKQLGDVKDRVSATEGEITSLKNKDQQHDSKLSELETAIANIDVGSDCDCAEKLGDGFSSSNTVASNISSVQSTANTNKSDIIGIKTNITSLTTRLLAVETELGLCNDSSDDILDELGGE